MPPHSPAPPHSPHSPHSPANPNPESTRAPASSSDTSNADLSISDTLNAAPSPVAARSWLFAPGDSDRKMAKAADGEADIVLLDLEDSVAMDTKITAREKIAAFLAMRQDKARIWVRVNPLNSGEIEADLSAIMAQAPGGIMLPKAQGRADIEALHQKLNAAEQHHNLPPCSTKIIALVTETAAAMFKTGDYGGTYPGAERLMAMSWGAEDLSAALGASVQFDENGQFMPVFELARSLCLLGAVAAKAAPIETIQSDFRDLETLRKRAHMVRSQGYRGMLAIHPAQVPVINDAFTPSLEELDQARAIVAAFAANPGAGTIGVNGAMLDRPHLELARALLAAALPQDSQTTSE